MQNRSNTSQNKEIALTKIPSRKDTQTTKNAVTEQTLLTSNSIQDKDNSQIKRQGKNKQQQQEKYSTKDKNLTVQEQNIEALPIGKPEAKDEQRQFKDQIALVAFSINFLLFLIIGIIGFAKGDSKEIDEMDEKYKYANLGTTRELKDSPPSVITAFFVTLAVGLFWLYLFVNYFTCVLTFCIYWKCFVFLLLTIIFFLSDSAFLFFAIVFLICFLIVCYGAYGLSQSKSTLDLIDQLSKQFGKDKKEIFLIQLISAFILLVLTLYFIYGYTGLMSVTEEHEENKIIITYDLDPRYRDLGIFYIFSFAWNIFCVIHHFKYCLANSITNWFNKKEQSLKENLKDSLYHFGSICFSSGFYLLFEIFDFCVSCLNSYSCLFCCIISLLTSLRFFLRKYLTCFVILELGRKNTSYLESCASVKEYVINKTLQFIFFTWAGDTVSSIISSSAFWNGIIIGIIVLVTTAYSFSFLFIVLTLIIMIIVCAAVSSLYSSAFEIILYTFAMCIHDITKKKQEVQNISAQLVQYQEIIQITYVKIETKITSGELSFQKLGVKLPQEATVNPEQNA